MASNFLQRVFRRSNEQRSNEQPNEQRSNILDNPAVPLASGAWQVLVDGSRHSAAGEVVNTSTAIQNAVVWTCVKVLAESIGALPLRLLKVDATGRSVDALNPIHRLLAAMPNPETTAIVFLEALMFSLLMNGNGYAQIQRNAVGQPVALWNLLPHKVQPIRTPTGDLAYKCDTNVDDAGDANWKVFKKEDIIHVKTFGMNGLLGVNPIEAQRQAIGASIGMTLHSSRLFANAATPQLALINKAQQSMSPVDKTRAREDWEKLQSGSNQHRIAILDSDFDIKQLSLTSEQSQFLQSREYTRSEICALWRVPEYKVGGSSKMTRANLEQEAISFVTETLKPYLIKIEQEFASKLLPVPSVVVSFQIEFDVTELLRGDSASMAAWFQAAIQSGYMSPAEVRHTLGLNPAPEEAGLTQYRCAVNYMNSSLLVGQEAPETNPMPEPITEGDEDSVNQRAAFRNYGATYGAIFTDAVRRVVSGEPTVRAFGPVVESLAESVAVGVNVGVNVEPDATRMVTYLTKLEARASTWTADNAESIAADVLKSAVKTFVFGSHEDAAKKMVAA